MWESLSRRDVCKSLLGASVGGGVVRRGNAEVSMADPLETFNYSGVRLLDGMLRRQTLYARDFFMNIPDDNFLLGFRARAGAPAPGKALAGWYGDDVFNAFGQYVSGMARLSKALGDTEIGAKAKRLVLEWAKTIEPDGFFYYSRQPNAPHYIYEKTMCGLVDLYEYGDFKEAAPLMKKITDWAAANLDRSRRTALDHAEADGNGEWYTLPENLYRAYQLTGSQEFKTFGDVWRYPAYWGMFTRDKAPDPFGFHAYSHVNSLSSCAMTYRVTHDPQYRTAVVNAFDWLERTQMFATGGYGPGETLLPPDGSLGRSLETERETFETVCGSWACFKLSRYLMAFTGQSFYGDWIEKLVYNGIGAALPLQPNGSNFYESEYLLSGGRKLYHGANYHGGKWTCCSGTYPQAIADYHNLIYFKSPEGIYVNLFVPSTVTWNHGDNEVNIEQETEYPDADTSTLTVRPRKHDSFTIHFRVPRWSTGASAEVNGSPIEISAQPGRWASVSRPWSDGDRLKFRISMQPVLRPIDAQHPHRVAISYGPVVLVRKNNWQLLRRDRDIAKSLMRSGGNLNFHLDDQFRAETPFVPFYSLGFGEPYQMYFDVQG